METDAYSTLFSRKRTFKMWKRTWCLWKTKSWPRKLQVMSFYSYLSHLLTVIRLYKGSFVSKLTIAKAQLDRLMDKVCTSIHLHCNWKEENRFVLGAVLSNIQGEHGYDRWIYRLHQEHTCTYWFNNKSWCEVTVGLPFLPLLYPSNKAALCIWWSAWIRKWRRDWKLISGMWNGLQ